jgi:LmbE family N-acetylglucosaminyl deacetylase
MPTEGPAATPGPAREDWPQSAMVIIAHPDDAEFTVAGTVALWARRGARVCYVVCTDGNAGSHEPGMTPERLAEIRRSEQRAACAVLGVQSIEFLGHDDGCLEANMVLRRELVRALRTHRPEVVVAFDPTSLFAGGEYINHPDHRAAAQAAIDAASPACAMPMLWPEVGPPHRVRRMYIFGNAEPNVWIDIGETLEVKIAALLKHASQLGDWDPSEMVRQWSSETGRPVGLAFAEAFRLMTLEDDDATA